MARHTVVQKKRKKRGPPATGKGTQIQVRLHADLLKPLDRWIADQPNPKPSRPDAVRRALTDWLTGLGLVDIGLSSSARRSASNVAESARIAGQTIDHIQDPDATLAQRGKRKRRLVKGPKEFREMRDDAPKPERRRS